MPARLDPIVFAHAVPAATVWRTWTFEPGVVVALLAGAAIYVTGLVRLWRAAGVGQGIRRTEAAAFAMGWLALVAALVSPIDALGEALFSAHMVQHELLMIVAAPLIVLGAPAVAFVWLLPAARRRPVFDAMRHGRVATAWAAVSAPAVVWLVHAVALWVWHLPALFDATLHSDLVHAAQHASFFGSAILFWWGITHGRYGRLGYGAAVVYVFATAVHSGVLGALLTFAPRAWYPTYATTAPAWGFTAVEDQQIGGLIMWVPAGVIYVGVGLAYFAAWIKASEQRSRFGAVTAVRSSANPSQRTPRTGRKSPVYNAPKVFSFVALLSLVLIQSIACTSGEAYRDAAAMTGGDPHRGPAAIRKYGCDTCHTIPGIRTATAVVGPPLTRVAARVYLAGHVPNTPDNMQQWIRHPHGAEPETVMPEMGVTESDARDIAAYLYTLR